MQDQRHRSDQSGDEAATRHVVAAQEYIGGDHQGQWQHRPGDLLQHHRVRIPRPGMALAVTRRRGQVDIAQHCVNAQCRNAQNRDLTEGIEATEVHKNDVDHVGATGAGFAVLEEELRNRRKRLCQHGQRNECHADTGCASDQNIPDAVAFRRLEGCPGWHVVQRQHQQDNRHHFNRQLRHRQVGS